MSVHPDVKKVLKDFHKNQKFIGLCCISPILAARVFGTKYGGPGVTITFGWKDEKWPYNDSIEAAREMGNNVKYKEVDEI